MDAAAYNRAAMVLRRTLLSAAMASSIFAADVVLLVLFLNPQLSLRREAAALALALGLPYAGLGVLAFATLALLGLVFRGHPRSFRPPLEGLPWFTTFSFLAIAAATGLFWLNLLTYRYSIPVDSVRALAGAAVGLSAAGFALVAVGADALLFPRRGRGAAPALVVLSCGAAVAVPLALRPHPVTPSRPVPLATETVQPARRVVLVGIDGLGPRQVESGLLPAVAGVLRKGAYGPLATLEPTEGPPIWTTLLTGRFPRDHGIKSFVTYRLAGSATPYELLPRGVLVGFLERWGLVSTAPVTSSARKRKALWTTLNAFGIATGVVRIWGTHPTEPVQGFMLSHYFHVLRHDPARVGATLFPPDLLPQVESRAVDPGDVDQALISQFVDVSVDVPGDRTPWRRDLVERALAPDMTYDRAGAVLRSAYEPPFLATYFYGFDVVGHTFTRFAEPERFGDVRTEEARRYGRVPGRYGAYLSQALERLSTLDKLAQGTRAGDVLLVVSGYGMEPVPFWRRAVAGAGLVPPMSGTHAGAPDGFLLVLGDGVRRGVAIRGASVLDVAPTILYLMGLPVARDMEGRVLTEIVDDDFARAHPLTFIPSYESLAVTPGLAHPEADLPPLPDEGP